MVNVQDLRDSTYEEAKELLSKYHKCVIIRPTSYGKTGILTRLIRDYKKVLYLYPSEVIKNAVLNFYYGYETKNRKKEIPNAVCWTYQHLAMAKEEELDRFLDVDLIIVDECHRIGGKKTSVMLHLLLEKCKKADLCGATATPERMDLYDIMTDFFENHSVSAYTLHDAFKDKIIMRPYYCYCAVDYKSDFEKIKKLTNREIEKMDSIEDRLEQKRKMNDHLREMATLVRMPNIIKTTCDECVKDVSYMKFIVFCADIDHINRCKTEVRKWFKKAYETHDIRTLIVSSENDETRNNIDKLYEFSHKNNTIDLIFSCDMLNMGYHVNDLTGIIMYRITDSQIIFSQQLGRVLSSGTNTHGLVFDIVDNIHRKSLYDVMGDALSFESKEEKELLMQYEIRIAKTEDELHEYGDLNEKEIEEYLELVCKYKTRSKRENDWSITKSDLIVTSFAATYDELMEKIMAEPISMRCRQTYEYWIKNGGRTDGEYAGIAGVLLQEKKAREINYGYCNDENSEFVPITPFAKIKHVSVQCVLETIFGKNKVKEYQKAIDEVMSNTLPRSRMGI